MKNNILKHSILLFVVFIFIVSVFGINKVFATSNYSGYSATYVCNGDNCHYSTQLYYPFNVPALNVLGTGGIWHSHNFVIYEDDGVFRLVSFNNSGIFYDDDYLYFNGNVLTYNHFRAIDKFHYDMETEEWVSDGYSWNPIAISRDSIRITSTTIYTDSSKNEVFCQPPLALEMGEKLAPIFQEIALGKVLQEIMGLLPVILSVLVSLLAFYKGLRILKTLLRQS